MKHTPTPWKQWARVIFSPENGVVCELSEVHYDHTVNHKPIQLGSDDWQEAMDNAKFIITACNAYDDLLEACEYAVAHLSVLALQNSNDVNKAILDMLLKAIAKAKEEENAES